MYISRRYIEWMLERPVAEGARERWNYAFPPLNNLDFKTLKYLF